MPSSTQTNPSLKLPGYAGVRPTQGQIKTIELDLRRAHTAEEIKQVLTRIDSPDISQDHVDFIEEIGKDWGHKYAKKLGFTQENPEWLKYETVFAIRKLRQLYTEVIKFDLLHGTQTAGYIPETLYKQYAENNMNDFAAQSDLQVVEQGVKHRASLTSVVRSAFNKITSILEECNIDPREISIYDFGCGTGKPSLIARIDYDFKNVVGIDYFKPVLEIGQDNRSNMGLEDDKKIAFKFRNAAKFQDFRGPVIACYCYNPFGADIMAQVAENLEQIEDPVIFAYNKPLHRDVFRAEKGWHDEIATRSLDADSTLTILTRNLHTINGFHLMKE